MQTTATETKEILNDLILINNDRIAGYEKAIEQLKSKENLVTEDIELIVLFEKMMYESRQHRTELGRQVEVAGGEIATGITVDSKLYRIWKDVKSMFAGKDRRAILETCEAGEDAAQKAYAEALEDDLPGFLRKMIIEQKELLRQSHNTIRALRDMSE